MGNNVRFLLVFCVLAMVASAAYADIWYRDEDDDGYGDNSDWIDSPTQPPGYVSLSGDCHDGDQSIHPGATEIVGDGIDQDCNNEELCYCDQDNDGWSISSTVVSLNMDCNEPGEMTHVTNPQDCVDTDNSVYPGAPEIVGDGIDQDCNNEELCYCDQDNDGWSISNTIVSLNMDCSDPGESDVVTNPTDCDDLDEFIYPGALEVCDDGIDQDCSGSDWQSQEYFEDNDGDGYGDGEFSVFSCTDMGAGWVFDDSDCDDTNDSIYPGAPEICYDLVDNNCNNQIDEGCDVFEILDVADVGNDQGGQVRLKWRRIEDDAPGVGDDITEYDIYRRLDANKSLPDKAWPPGDWDFIAQVPASGENEYNTVVPSLCDSTDAGICWSIFFLRARTTSTYVFHDTPPDSGYSVDNLPPMVPTGLKLVTGDMLTWDDPIDADFQYFTVFGSAVDHLDGTESLIKHTITTSHDIAGHSYTYFLVTAHDIHGNQSEAAVLDALSNVPGIRPDDFALHQCVPNPFNPVTTISFDLPKDDRVHLYILDVAGRLVRTLHDHEMIEAGRRKVLWHGDDQSGSPVAAGVYFYRLEAGDFIDTKRMVLLK